MEGQRYAVLEGPETDAETVQELWLAVVENREITVELVRPRAKARGCRWLGLTWLAVVGNLEITVEPVCPRA